VTDWRFAPSLSLLGDTPETTAGSSDAKPLLTYSRAMARIDGIDPRNADPDLRSAFEAQVESWGEVLHPYLVYARRPTVFRAVRGMWDGLEASGLLDGALKAMVCRRVATHNGCVF